MQKTGRARSLVRAPLSRRILGARAALAAAAALLAVGAVHAGEAQPEPQTPPGRARPEGSSLVVVLDPGHGGPFPHDGAHGTRGLIEKTIALQVTRRLQADLEEAGATVLLTREDDDADVSLADRARFANEANADLFVSIHCNSMATRHDRTVTRGVESYFLSPDPTDAEAKMLAELENGGPAAVPLPKSSDAVTGLLADLALGQARNDSAVLAETLHRALVRKTFAPSRGVRQAPFLVLSGTKMPSALIEIGFISHPVEGRLLAKDAYQQKIADALAEGIRDFAAQVLLRRLLPPTEAARAELLARRSEAAHERALRKGAANSLGSKPSLAPAGAVDSAAQAAARDARAPAELGAAPRAPPVPAGSEPPRAAPALAPGEAADVAPSGAAPRSTDLAHGAAPATQPAPDLREASPPARAPDPSALASPTGPAAAAPQAEPDAAPSPPAEPSPAAVKAGPAQAPAPQP